MGWCRMSAEIVPFGKYKGQPAEALLADQEYCQWLTSQPWFRDRWPNVYNVVINYGAEPQDSPEHNEMQARFLDDDLCFRLAEFLCPQLRGSYETRAAVHAVAADPFYAKYHQCCEIETVEQSIAHRTFEDRGWDVVYSVYSARALVHIRRLVPPLPACTCECDHADCRDNARCHGGAWYCLHESCKERGLQAREHCTPTCYWHGDGPLSCGERERFRAGKHTYEPEHPYVGSIRIELKPDLGDDFPAVLRQVKKYPAGDINCVIARRHQFEHVTWDQVRRIFAASRIALLAENEIAAQASATQITDGAT